jgi:hypothetical protein
MLDNETYQSLIERKCNFCFRKDSQEDRCMLFSERHSGIELCLGPFKDQEDRMRKVREDFERDRKQADLSRAVRQVVLNDFLRKKKKFDDWKP